MFEVKIQNSISFDKINKMYNELIYLKIRWSIILIFFCHYYYVIILLLRAIVTFILRQIRKQSIFSYYSIICFCFLHFYTYTVRAIFNLFHTPKTDWNSLKISICFISISLMDLILLLSKIIWGQTVLDETYVLEKEFLNNFQCISYYPLLCLRTTRH